MNSTKLYYEHWLGKLDCLSLEGVHFILSDARDVVQDGYSKAFDLYVWIDEKRIIVSYGKKATKNLEELKRKISVGQNVNDVLNTLSTTFNTNIGHHIKYFFDRAPQILAVNHTKILTVDDYLDYETFFKTLNPNTKDTSWLREYFDEMVEENLCVAVYENSIIACCTDAPMMPYLPHLVQEIGVNTLPEYQKLGYAKMASAVVVENILMNNSKEPLWSTTAANISSQKLAEKVGFKKFADVLTLSLD